MKEIVFYNFLHLNIKRLIFRSRISVSSIPSCR